MKKRIYLSPPHMSGNEIKYIKKAFESNWIAPLGPNVDAFESIIADYLNVKHSLALSSGTAAIHLILRDIGVKENDHVFCSSLTFAGSCFPILYLKANPVFIDIDKSTLNMSPNALKKAFEWASNNNKMPKAVIVVDLYGQSADYDNIKFICDRYNVPIIEDAAEALGSTYKGKKCGSLGDYGILSFNGNKIITTSGGGMVVSNNKAAIEKIRYYSTQARENTRHYEHIDYGYNYRLSNICASIGIGQMEVLDKRINRKKEIYEKYKEGFKDTLIKMMPIASYGEPNYWLSVIFVDKLLVDKIIIKLDENNIEARPLWKPMHMQPVFKDCLYFMDDTDNSKDLYLHGICLPSGTSMSNEDQERVIDIIKECLHKC